jgi:mono/diheme cytochrome c family protein
MVDYQDTNLSIEERARAYLAMNCAHCHNPDGWEEPAKRDFDFRYELPLDQTGILYEKDKIVESLMEGEMPFIGTTLLDQEGLSLIIDFIDNL